MGAAAAGVLAAIAAPMVLSCAAAAVNSSGTVLNDIHSPRTRHADSRRPCVFAYGCL